MTKRLVSTKIVPILQKNQSEVYTGQACLIRTAVTASGFTERSGTFSKPFKGKTLNAPTVTEPIIFSLFRLIET